MMFSFTYKSMAVAGLAVCALFSSCSDDKEDEVSYTIPTTYNFQNVNYSGQTARLAMLTELNTYVRTGNTGAILDAQKMKNMYANTNAPFADAALNTSGKQLKDKTILSAQTVIENYFNVAAGASLSAGTPALNGKAGLLTTAENSKYLVDANGVEPGQVIQKGLMGAVFYFQAVESYLTPSKTGPSVDNVTVTPGEGTTLEHHFDEAFGYFGAPIDFPTNVTGLKFWANYSNQVNPSLGSNKTMMDAFLKGRAAISAKDAKGKDAAIATLRTEWERIVAASAILELNAAKANIADQAKKSHYLSEALGFIMSLKYKTDRKISDAQYNEVMTKIGTNFYNTTAADITAAVNVISTAYGMDNIKSQL
ncbi:hypothetical protein TH63_06280 [Rufibacter radiotolerans]|uniref:DUF4856 domain-containing protein n=1 Tax=Rufibacter radiotolerans TaxID=1379910 RepID=A0A0H4W4I5_9BACT|nr:DUF4856 domain-containing protein [Rufibacter radiotolerans]AKQ45331.1 hypothetical protein TH63_06280 [Rufibacter radiotolerans]